ncbi:hypothetical protein [Caldinitratiruptor microaerophilus]|uniref:Uncharacterized protein n=1 Tax=Caldinitratiruptor microaerophilus TaxID=671077 RepID=A0AA35G6P5_9FIRM|nr:hypothetical protein [Caldinitratiruptor microaerophilus]BDG59241.1 hypothetical protein caldi_03310 [Caldinitratiruptor microaerophilus]
MAEAKGGVPPPLAVFVDPVHMLAAIHPLLALAALSPSAAVVAASNLMDLFSPAQNPVAALVAFQLGWEWASRLAAGGESGASRSGSGGTQTATLPRPGQPGPVPADQAALFLATVLAAARAGAAPVTVPPAASLLSLAVLGGPWAPQWILL